MWAAGRYADVAEHVDDVPPAHLLALVEIEPGHAVLDVATGTGNVALRAAALSARRHRPRPRARRCSTSPARARTTASTSHWIEGDAEALPFGDASVRPRAAPSSASSSPRATRSSPTSSLRVCRPGGAIGLVNWTPEGLIGRALPDPRRLLARRRPRAPRRRRCGATRSTCARCSRRTSSLSFERGINPFVFPSVDEYMTFFEERYGPTLKAKERLTADGRWEDAAPRCASSTRR